MPRSTSHPGYIANKAPVQARLKRIEGQVRGIQRMVEDERYCIDILTQITAIQAALDKVGLGLLDDHAKHCVIGPEDAASARRADRRDDGRRRAPDAPRLEAREPVEAAGVQRLRARARARSRPRASRPARR